MSILSSPTNVAVTETGSGSARATWDDSNPVGVSVYTVKVSNKTLPSALYFNTVSSATKFLDITGLPTGIELTIEVRAIADSDFTDSFYSSSVLLTLSSGGGGGAVCFLGSAPVLTPAGYRRIDSLSMGDLVRTADGRDVAVKRVKHQRIEAPSAAVNPYVIQKGVWGAMENLAISPRHCVAVPGRGMVEARFLGLKQMPMRAAFDYYNLELPEWDNMVVAGVEVESLAPRKRVEMTVAELAKIAVGIPMEKLARAVTILADGKVAVHLTRKERRTTA